MVQRIGIILVFTWLVSFTAHASVIEVGPGKAVTTLSAAIESAQNGDTIAVYGGRYKEAPILIDKQLVLIGHDKPVIDGEGKHEVIKVTADNVHINGFRVIGSGVSHTRDNAAIRFDRAQGGSIINNELDSNFFGIYLARGHHMTIKDNKITTYAERETQSANGIHLWDTRNVNIENNLITGHRDGIYLEYVENSTISKNQTEKNLRYGLHFMFSDSCIYDNNKFINNGAGVAVMYSRRVIMKNNHFLDNWGSSSYGLLLKDINDSFMEGNYFRNNTIGIRIDGGNRTEVRRNHFEQNGWAIRILSNSMDNLIAQNNFINNTFDVATNSRQNFSNFNNNYWSKYSGYDLKGDGIGDVPYRPVRLFSLIIEQNPTALMLLRSFFIEILDMAERVMPVLTPETLVDDNPSMKPFEL